MQGIIAWKRHELWQRKINCVLRLNTYLFLSALGPGCVPTRKTLLRIHSASCWIVETCQNLPVEGVGTLTGWTCLGQLTSLRLNVLLSYHGFFPSCSGWGKLSPPSSFTLQRETGFLPRGLFHCCHLRTTLFAFIKAKNNQHSYPSESCNVKSYLYNFSVPMEDFVRRSQQYPGNDW